MSVCPMYAVVLISDIVSDASKQLQKGYSDFCVPTENYIHCFIIRDKDNHQKISKKMLANTCDFSE